MDNFENQIPNEEEGVQQDIPAAENTQLNSADFTEEQEAAVEQQSFPAEEQEAPAAEETAESAPFAPEEPEQEIPAARRPASPYENSPYVINRPVQQKYSKPPKAKPRKRSFWKTALCAILILALISGGCVTTGVLVNSYWEERTQNLESAFEEKLNELETKIDQGNAGTSVSGSPLTSSNGGLTPAQVYAQNVESVVMIYNQVTGLYNGQYTTGTSTGSGFILNDQGYVVTNCHVVDGDGTLAVITSDGQEHPAVLVGADNTNDVALLKIEAQGLKGVTLGSSSDLIVGDQVVAIGNPLGELTSTLTVGYISAKERDVNTEGFAINMLQTDAAINSGNSGGPLFNMKGEVIGITTAKYSGTSSSGATIEGVGFAIPIDDVSGLLSDLATYGYIKGAYLGVMVSDTNANAAAYYGMPMGAYVESVETGYAAQRAGIQSKDIIIKLGEYEVGNVNDLTRALRNFEAGDTTIIVVYRGGREMKLPITLDEKPGTSTQEEPAQTTPGADENMPEGDFDEWYDYLAPFFGMPGGND